MKHLNDMLTIKGIFLNSVQDKVNRPHLQWKWQSTFGEFKSRNVNLIISSCEAV